jgi:hypothetical protein
MKSILVEKPESDRFVNVWAVLVGDDDTSDEKMVDSLSDGLNRVSVSSAQDMVDSLSNGLSRFSVGS